MTSLFGDSSDEDMPSSSTVQPHPVIRALVSSLLGRALPLTLADLRPTTGSTTPSTPTNTALATSLEHMHECIDNDEWTTEALMASTQHINETSWALFKATSTSIYKECFILSTLVQVGTFDALGHTERAFEKLDHAFVVGGPTHVLRPVLKLLSKKRTTDTHKQSSGEGQESQTGQESQEGTTQHAWGNELLLPFNALHLNRMESWYKDGTKIKSGSSTSTMPPIEFYNNHYRTEEPVVLPNLTVGWAAMSKWSSLAYWVEEHGHRVVPMEVGRHHEEGWKEDWIDLHTFVSQYIVPSNQRVVAFFDDDDSTNNPGTKMNKEKKGDGAASKRKELPVPRMPLPDIAQVGYIAQHTMMEQLPYVVPNRNGCCCDCRRCCGCCVPLLW